MAGIDDVSLAQSAYHLTRGRIALAMIHRQDDWPVKSEITNVGSIADRGPYDLDIYQNTTTGCAARAIRHYFAAERVTVPTYPVHLGAQRESRRGSLIVESDSEGQIKGVSPKYRSWIELQVRRQHGYVDDTVHEEIKGIVGEKALAASEDLKLNAQRIWTTATRVHYSPDVRFNSQSLVVAMTEMKMHCRPFAGHQ